MTDSTLKCPCGHIVKFCSTYPISSSLLTLIFVHTCFDIFWIFYFALQFTFVLCVMLRFRQKWRTLAANSLSCMFATCCCYAFFYLLASAKQRQKIKSQISPVSKSSSSVPSSKSRSSSSGYLSRTSKSSPY